jgi:hypothetical protein
LRVGVLASGVSDPHASKAGAHIDIKTTPRNGTKLRAKGR